MSLSYETALKLKEAGFSQTREDGSLKGTYIFPDGVTLADKNMSEKAVYVPPLEELIQECGEKLGERESVLVQYYPRQNKAFACIKLNESQEGINPKEAVANLYLALNKK